MLSAGAFSDDAVIEATKEVVCVYVDVEWGRKHGELAERYGVQALPTVVYADPEGEEIGRMSSFDPATIAAEISSLAREHTRSLR